MKNLILLFLTFLLPAVSYSAQSQLIHQPYLSGRVMARGGTMTSVADSFETVMYNPAGLARFEKGDINLALTLAGTPSILSFYSDLGGAGSNPVNIQNTITAHLGDHYASRVGLGAIWARPSWGVAIIPMDFALELDINASSIGVQGYQDTTILFAKAWNLDDNKMFNLGFSPKIIYRAYFEKDVTVFDLVANSSIISPSDAQEGLAVDADFGLLYSIKPPDEGWFKWMKHAKPTLGFAVRNILDGAYRANFHLFGASSTTPNAKLERRFDVGTRFDLPEFWVFVPRAMIEFRDMGTRYASLKKCLHIGAELFWKAFSWLEGSYMVGYSEGYITAGVSGQLSVFRIDLSTYAEEVGSTSTGRESRRWMAKLSMDF